MNIAELLDNKITSLGREIERPREGIAKVRLDHIDIFTTEPSYINEFDNDLDKYVTDLASVICENTPGIIKFMRPTKPLAVPVWEVFEHNGTLIARMTVFDINRTAMVVRLYCHCYREEPE